MEDPKGPQTGAEGGSNRLHSPITRRSFLQGAVASAVALPALGGATHTTSLRSFWAAMSGANKAALPQRSGTLKVANLSEPNFIDPAYALEVEEFAVVRNVYDGLLQWNAVESQLMPALATSWSSNANATEWTFNLRPGVTFQDGTPFNSSTMKATLSHSSRVVGLPPRRHDQGRRFEPSGPQGEFFGP